MIKKLFISLIIGVSLICFAMFFARHDSCEKTTIQFASWGSESEVSILKPIIQNFEKENPEIKVLFMHIPQNYFQKIHLLFASNTAPDVIFMNNQYLPIYANAGVLEDLSDLNFEFDKFYPQAINAMKWKNKRYGIPRDISNLVVFYNKDLFNRYKIDYPAPNWTLEDLLDISKKLTHLPNIFGISFDEEPLCFIPYITVFGGWTQKDVDNFFNTDITKNNLISQGLNFYADLRKKYHVAPYKQESASATMAQLFLQQRLGMYVSGRWMVPKFRSEANFNWDVAPFPKLNKQTESYIPLDASGWVISGASKNKAAAVKLVKYLASKKSIEYFTQSGLIVPARIDVANSKVFLDGKAPKSAKVFLEAVSHSKPTPSSLRYKEIIDELKKKTEYVFN